MTDKLREAALAALNMLNDYHDCLQAANILRVGLSEPTVQESLTVAVQERMHPEIKKMYEDYFDKCFRESSAQQRQWVGLTDEEILEMFGVAGTSGSDINPRGLLKDTRRIEAKLKEKNGG